jgi:hypothetical protein
VRNLFSFCVRFCAKQTRKIRFIFDRRMLFVVT